MNSIGQITAGHVDWNKIAENIKGVDATKGASDINFNMTRGLKITTGGVSLMQDISIKTPILDEPMEINTSVLNSISQKVMAPSLGTLTPTDVENCNQALLQQLTYVAENKELQDTQPKVFFDLYKTLALIQKSSQVQRSAARDIRQSENVSIQNTIKTQADIQKNAAITGAVTGAILTTMQVVGQSASMVGMGLNLKAKITAGNDFKVKEYANDYKAASNRYDEVARGNNADAITNQREILQTAATQLTNAERLTKDSTKYMKACTNESYCSTTNSMMNTVFSTLQGGVRAFTDTEQARATALGAEQKRAEESLDQIKDIFSQSQDVIKSVQQLMLAVLQAETQSMHDAIQV